MNQDEIFKLLLVILLISSEKSSNCNCCQTMSGSLNEIIIISLLFNPSFTMINTGNGSIAAAAPRANTGNNNDGCCYCCPD